MNSRRGFLSNILVAGASVPFIGNVREASDTEVKKFGKPEIKLQETKKDQYYLKIKNQQALTNHFVDISKLEFYISSLNVNSSMFDFHDELHSPSNIRRINFPIEISVELEALVPNEQIKYS